MDVKPFTLAGLVALLAGAGAYAHDAGPAPSIAIRGQVVAATDEVPLRRALVVVSSGDRPVESIVTDDEGRFAISTVAATPLTVRASKAGYVAGLTTIAAGSAEIRFSLARSAAVMGRVLDSYGAPVRSAYVTGRLILPDSETATQSMRFFTPTDRLGEYRLGSLPAGRYEVTAVRVPPELMDGTSKLETHLFGPPERLDLASGISTLTLAPGAEAGNVDFTIPGSSDSCPAGSSQKPAEGAVAGTIAGRVTGPSGEPLACAVVRFVAADQSLPEAYTDAQGRYSLENLPAGSFLLEASRADYIALQYGQRQPADAATAIALDEGERRTRTDFVLPRASIISGTVADEHGEPVEGIMVWPFQHRPIEGFPRWNSNAVPVRTDDRGRYRVIGVTPGTYVLAALTDGPAHSSEDAGRARGYAPVYHRGTLDVANAQRLEIEVGRDADDVDFELAPTLLTTVRGSVLDATGRPFVGDVMLLVSDRSGAPTITSRMVTTDTNGAFVFRHVPPGDYVVKAPGRTDGIPPQFGMQRVTVVDADPPYVTVALTGGATLEGRVIIQGAPDTDVSGMKVSVLPVDPDYSPGIGPGTRPAGGTLRDGSFRLVGVRGPARLLVEPDARCSDCYVQSVRVNGMDATDAPFDFGLTGGEFRDVEIIVSEAGATIEGRATAEPSAAVASFSVVVYATTPALWSGRSRHVRVVRSKEGGMFRVAGLPPGDYFVAAVSRLDTSIDGAQADPDALDGLSAGASRITLLEGDLRTLNLRLIRR
jgi:protocatechuate 3,4-dioxygenase beta subunit